jgi:flagellar biosynthesis/type III secretory pathway chaperone
MDTVGGQLQSKLLMDKGVDALIGELADIVKLEREFTIASNGEALNSLIQRKANIMIRLKDLLNSGYKPTEEIKEKLNQIHIDNQVNIKLLRSVIKLISGYKEILKDVNLDSGTYGKNGAFSHRPLSLRFNGTV